MKLIVGLGNPGRKYEGTRHNVGFELVDELVRRTGPGGAGVGGTDRSGTDRSGTVGGKSAFRAETFDVKVGGERVLLLKPQTFMNLSGSSVVEARDFYKLTNDDLLVVCDDLNLPLGKLRIRAQGSSGGQKGLEDCIRRLGGDQFGRLRIGIGSPPDRMDAADFVLAKYAKGEREEIGHAVVTAADAAEVWVREGVAVCMNRYN